MLLLSHDLCLGNMLSAITCQPLNLCNASQLAMNQLIPGVSSYNARACRCKMKPGAYVLTKAPLRACQTHVNYRLSNKSCCCMAGRILLWPRFRVITGSGAHPVYRDGNILTCSPSSLPWACSQAALFRSLPPSQEPQSQLSQSCHQQVFSGRSQEPT